MVGAERFRERAAYLRQLASTERDISVKQALAAMAVRFDQFADELEELESQRESARKCRIAIPLCASRSKSARTRAQKEIARV